MSLPKSFLDELRARVPISDVVSKRMRLTRAGREHKGCCPFHKEKTPSFTVNDQKGFYHCFGCGKHGDVVGFIMDHDNLRFMEAVEQLAGLAGMQVPKPTREEAERFERQMSMYDLMDEAAKWYEQQLHDQKNKKIIKYLIDRGLSLSSIKEFRLGFAPSDDTILINHLKKTGYSIENSIEIGLFKISERKKGEVYPFFRGRVIFPVQDFQGRVVAFGGRVLPESHGGPPDKSAPKYINSPETAIFHKGKMLYGLSRARKAIGEGEPVIVVEGYMDVIALSQAGFRAAVAPLGTALTETQVEELWRVMPEGKKSPILCFDGDTAGQRAAGRSLERILPILKPDHSAKFAFLPEEHDPDSLIQAEGVQAMKRVAENAVGIFDMMWAEESRGRDFSQPEAKAGFRSALEKRARAIPNSSVQEFFIHEINQKIKSIFLQKELNISGKNKRFEKVWGAKKPVSSLNVAYRPPQLKPKPVRAEKLLREKILIATLINHPYLFEEFGEEFGMIEIPDQGFSDLRHELIGFLASAGESDEISLDVQTVKQHLMGLGYGKILEDIFDRSLYLHASFARPDQPPETVRQGWLDAYARGQEQSRWKKG